jgi:hypothetical protein
MPIIQRIFLVCYGATAGSLIRQFQNLHIPFHFHWSAWKGIGRFSREFVYNNGYGIRKCHGPGSMVHLFYDLCHRFRGRYRGVFQVHERNKRTYCDLSQTSRGKSTIAPGTAFKIPVSLGWKSSRTASSGAAVITDLPCRSASASVFRRAPRRGRGPRLFPPRSSRR